MNMQKKLKVVLVILTIILVSLISFGGIYYRNKSEMSNHLPQYLLGTDLKGYRQVTLKVASDEKESEDNEESSESEETTAEDNNDENTNNEEVANTTESEETTESEDTNNKENFKKSAEIYKNRLKSLKVNNYSVSCDEETGRIVITIPENDQTDTILSDLSQQGKFAIKDSKTEEDLLTNEDVRSVKVGKTTNASGTTTTYMSVYFNTKGTNKFRNVTENYQNEVEENTTDNNEIDNEINNESNEENNQEDNSEEENSENEVDGTEESEEKEEESNSAKQVKLNIDDVTMMTTSFQEIIDNGVLSLTLGASEDQSMDELYSAYNLGAIIENDSLPIKYEIEGNTFISSVIENDEIKTIIYVEIGLALFIMLLLIAKYRLKGLMASISSIGYIAILLITIRYANVSISLLGLFAIELCYIMNCIYSFMKYKLINDDKLTEKEKSRKNKDLIKRYISSLAPIMIIAIVCCFTQWLQLLSFGTIVFWGIIIGLAYNIIIDKILD